MAGAHLGGRGAGRRRSCSATAAPREQAPGVAAMLMGATTHGRSAAFLSPNSDRRVTFVPVTKIMLMDHPHRSTSDQW